MTTIAFDGICLGDGPATGVSRSFLNALTAYAERSQDECILLMPLGTNTQAIRNVRIAEAPRGRWRRQRHLPALLRTLHVDILHSSVASVPLRAPCPTIATAHDLPWLHPELDETTSVWRSFATRRALRSATRILAPSTMTVRDVQFLLGQRCPAIECIMHGTDLGPAPTVASIETRDGPLLVLGDDRGRKNHQRLVQAHRLARTRCRDLPALAFVGPPHHYIGETEKIALLHTCRFVVHVSLFEGFGMPVLEGLAHGAPVVCSDLPPHHEIAQQHALFVDPYSIEAIATGLERMHCDATKRWQVASGGHVRAHALQPSNTAGNWARVHREVMP